VSNRPVEFRVLGPVEVVAGDVRVAVGGPRQRKLLALLLLNVNELVATDRIVEALWDEPPRSAHQQIHNVVRMLRQVLGGLDVTVVHSANGYRLEAPPTWVDVWRFQSALREARQAEVEQDPDTAAHCYRRALGLWRGPAIAGLASGGLAHAAAELDERRLTAVERLVALRRGAQESLTLIGELVDLVAEHPLREQIRAGLMIALAENGRQSDALAVYEEGRRILADELGVDPGTQLRAAHEFVLRGPADEAPTATGAGGTEPAPASPPPSRPARWCLPYGTRDFVGRDAEIERLLTQSRDVRPGAVVISAIDGMGGVGKTALAVHVAQQAADAFVDGHYFIDLQGHSDGRTPLTPTLALEVLLRESGVAAEDIPEDAVDRSNLWRSQVAARRILLVLDNARDEPQVRPLLPGLSEAFVLVTSRRRLASLESTASISLDVLPHDAAFDLFARIVGHERARKEPEAVAEVVALCGHLPLAVRLAAARLRARDSWTVAHLATRLRIERSRNRPPTSRNPGIMDAIALSHDRLPPDLGHFFRRLSVIPGSEFDARTAAAWTGLSPTVAEFHLESLFDESLLLESSPGCYRFHDLVHKCAFDLLNHHETPEDRTAAEARIAGHGAS
jgi:DNA-binding SARP family transcriptional activator